MEPSLDDALLHLRRNRRPRNRMEAVRTLGDLRDSRAVPGLAAALSDSDFRVRRAAAAALAHIGEATALSALCEAVNDRGSYVRRIAAVSGLRQLRSQEVVAVLCQALCDPHAGVRVSGAVALGQIANLASTPVLSLALRDGHRDVRAAAARALLLLADPSASDALCGALDDSCPEVRSLAADALGSARCSTALPRLRNRLQGLEAERVPEVLNSIRQSINRLEAETGEQVALPPVTSPTRFVHRPTPAAPPVQRRTSRKRESGQPTLW